MTEIVENTYLVLIEKMYDTKVKLDKLVAKSLKYMPDAPLTYRFGEKKKVNQHRLVDGKTVTYKAPMIEVIVNNVIPKIGNFEFLGKVTAEDGMVFVDMVPFEAYPFDTEANPAACDHCKKSRQRKLGYIVRSVDTDEILQVGKSCLREYLGHDPARVLRSLSVLNDLEESMERFGNFFKPIYLTEEVLTYTKIMIDRFGWLSKGRAAELDRDDATAYRVIECVIPSKKPKDFVKDAHQAYDARDEKMVEYIKKVMAWFEEIEYGQNDYMDNLSQFGGIECFTNIRRFGLLCSAVAAFDKETKKLEATKALAENSEYVGQVKERLRGLEVVQKSCYERETQWGTSYAYQLIDKLGNVFMYWGTVFFGAENGDTIILDGTVKKHDEFRGVKQTHLTRCKIID